METSRPRPLPRGPLELCPARLPTGRAARPPPAVTRQPWAAQSDRSTAYSPPKLGVVLQAGRGRYGQSGPRWALSPPSVTSEQHGVLREPRPQARQDGGMSTLPGNVREPAAPRPTLQSRLRAPAQGPLGAPQPPTSCSEAPFSAQDHPQGISDQSSISGGSCAPGDGGAASTRSPGTVPTRGPSRTSS